MAQAQKKTVSVEEFKKNHPEVRGWHIVDTGTRLIAFKFTDGNQIILDRIEKRGGRWYDDLGRLTGNLWTYHGYRPGCSLSDFFSGLTSACTYVQEKIIDGTIKIANPLSKKLDKLMLAAIVFEELIPIKVDVDSMIDLAYVLFTSDLSKIGSSDSYGSVGVFQTLPSTHARVQEKYPSCVGYSFEKSNTYEKQAIVGILLAYDNLALFNKKIFKKYPSLQVAWASASEKEQLEFTVFVAAAMHNAPSSTLRAFRSALDVLASGNFTLSSLMSDVARELNFITTSSVRTGTYANRIVKLYNRLKERGFANLLIYPGGQFKSKIKGFVYKKINE